MERKKPKWGILLLAWIFLGLLAPSLGLAQSKKLELIGREILNFTLPSSQDRLISYADEYYGKYHLILTFFPAAFTPI
ncbi:MAG: hypothetical protein N3G78_12505 [Desulfobacterota bacterium]|nr:hypothetical protein [Thermodesulfobacteriota bacterium]